MIRRFDSDRSGSVSLRELVRRLGHGLKCNENQVRRPRGRESKRSIYCLECTHDPPLGSHQFL